MNFLSRIRTATAALLVSWLSQAASGADVSDLLFTVEIGGTFAKPTFTITNDSPNLKIETIAIDIADTRFMFQSLPNTLPTEGPAGKIGQWNVNGERNIHSQFFPDFSPGQSQRISPTVLNAGTETEATENAFFNNGTHGRATVEVTSGLKRAKVTLDDRAVFTSTFRGPERRLTLSSLVPKLSPEEPVSTVNAVQVFRNGNRLNFENFTGQTFTVAQGDNIRVVATPEVFKGMDAEYLDDISLEGGDISDLAAERFVAVGMSVNNLPLTADPTDYSFEITEDTTIDVRWDHFYALTVDHDFSKTQSLEVNAGTPWAGPLTSGASGSPAPGAGKHWVKKGERPTLEVDGFVVESLAHPGLDIRYVVKGYRAYGPPDSSGGVLANDLRLSNGVDISRHRSGRVESYAPGTGTTLIHTTAPHGLPINTTARITISGSSDSQRNESYTATVTGERSFRVPVQLSNDPVVKGEWTDTTYNSFVEFSNVAPRQKIADRFDMFGPGGVTYVWQIQYGVRLNGDLPERNSLVRVFEEIDGQVVERTVLNGVAWFDPGSKVWAMTRTRETGVDGQTLTGWISGDGHYFASQGQVDPATGAPVSGEPARINGSPVARWEAHSEQSNHIFNGLSGYGIPSLQRPVRAVWRYGAGAINLTVTIGKHLFEDYPQYASIFVRQPDPITVSTPDPIAIAAGGVPPSPDLMAEWDPVAGRLYPTIPGQFVVPWKEGTTGTSPVEIRVTATLPFDSQRNIRGHYPHIHGAPPVALDPDPNDSLVFRSIKYSTARASVDADNLFSTGQPGISILLFSEVQQGRGQPREFLRVRVVDTRAWDSALPASPTSATVGSKILDPGADAANLGTGFLYNLRGRSRHNPFIYDSSVLDGLAARDIYDMERLTADSSSLVVVNKAALPGPIIPVNEHPGVSDDTLPIVVWYDDPRRNDLLMWPNVTRIYRPRWPAASAVPQIVIASQLGSDGKDASGRDQQTAPALGTAPAAFSYDPSRLQAVQIYSQPDRNAPGFNPNEEHALVAPSLRYADVSPRPPAIYALRDGDLNTSVGTTAYTSHPFVLAQFFDVAADEVRMQVYSVKRQSDISDTPQYRFANNFNASINSLRTQPFVTMEAGEPVIPFYPLGVAIGASVPAETFGNNFFAQEAYWEDWRGSSWAISGGSEAWFNVSFYYPLAPDFYWPDGLKVPRIVINKDGSKYTASFDERNGREPVVPSVGDAVAFLPSKVTSQPSKANLDDHLPTRVIFKSEWPENPPILKAGETLTFSGGEYRADNPTTVLVKDGEATTVETPGLPQLTAFASAEVVFDSLNPGAKPDMLRTSWTARVVQALDVRTAPLAVTNFPAALQPASGRTRVDKGKFVFNELPASLQRRMRYDPVNGRLELSGLLNDKDISDRTLTAAPPAVYSLEPNILTGPERDALRALSADTEWTKAVDALYGVTRNPDGIAGVGDAYVAGLMRQPLLNPDGSITRDALGTIQYPPNPGPAQLRAFGPGLALVPNGNFLDPTANVPDVSYVTVVENNDPSLGGSPITPHIIKIDRRLRYRGSIQTILSDNVFDENVMLRSTGDFGANADDLVFEWWYRPDDGSLNVPPPDLIPPGQPNPWKLFPDPSGKNGAARYQIMLMGNPNAPETLLADTHWFARYRHKNDRVTGTNWGRTRPVSNTGVNYTWAGAGNSDPFNDRDLNGIPDFRAQLALGWIKRVLDAVNPYEARIRDFEGDAPATVVSMISQFGPRFEGPVALNPSKNVIENVGLIELYETILKRGRDLSIDLSRPVSTPAIANALQLASTRISDFYTVLGNEAYVDSLDPTIGHDSGSVASSSFAFQNQVESPIAEELALLRGVDDFFARPVYNRLFWNFTKGEGEAAYATSYNLSDINQDGFIDEDDAMLAFPQGHGDAWGHYLTALRNQYDLLRHPMFNWVSRSESYNLQDIVITVDFLDERKFAAAAAQKAKAGAEIVSLTYRDRFVADPTAQWQGYTDSNPDRAWGVDEWSRRAGQGAYFDWVTANALLPAQHPNENLEGIQKVDRTTNSDINVISANLNSIQSTIDQADNGYNPLGLQEDALMFDLDPSFLEWGSGVQGQFHFDQVYERAIAALDNASAAWDVANEQGNQLRNIGTSEAEFRNSTFQEDLSFRNKLIQIFGRPYEGTVGPGRLYPAGYNGPDLALYMYVPVRKISKQTVPGPSKGFAEFNTAGELVAGTDPEANPPNSAFYDAFLKSTGADGSGDTILGFESELEDVDAGLRALFAPTFVNTSNTLVYGANAKTGLFDVNYTDLTNPKVALENFVNQMPVTAAGYTFQAPDTWGNRPANGELQNLINQMIRQEAEIARAIGAWDSLSGDIIRTLRLINARLTVSGLNQGRDEVFSRVRLVVNDVLKVIEVGREINATAHTLTTTLTEATKDGIPLNLPTGGLAISPGDALSLARLGIGVSGTIAATGFDLIDDGLKIAKLVADIGFGIAENELNIAKARDERKLQIREWLKEIEDKVGDEPILRIAIFKEIQALQELSDKYRTLLDEGARLVEERAAFNKRVAAQTQRQRYRDMTFRVSRNHALTNYRSAFDLAARYAYLAATAYDYETNFAVSDPASPATAYKQIISARRVGALRTTLSRLKANFDSQRSQLGLNNSQREVTEFSLRREWARILPETSPAPETGDNQLPPPGSDSASTWRSRLQEARVPDLWQVDEFREHCRPFASATDAAGRAIAQPGIVLRFTSDIQSGKNFFGHPLSGGDQAFSTSHFSTKFLGMGAAFEGYRTDDLTEGLAATPRIYFIPGGQDIMRISRSDDPDAVRMWNVVEQAIPVPYPATSSQLQQSGYIPLLDSLNGRIGTARRHSDFRAYPETMGDAFRDSRLIGRSVWNTEWLLIIPGASLSADPNEGLDRFVDQVSDIKLILETYSHSGG